VFFATATSLDDLAPPHAQVPLKIFVLAVFALLPVGVLIYARLLRRIDREGPKTRPDLFTAPDILAIGVVFALMFLPAVVVRIADAVTALTLPSSVAPAAPAEPPAPGLPSLEHKAPAKPKAPLDTAQVMGVMLALSLPTLGLIAVIMIRGARPSDMFGLGKVPFFRAVGLGITFALLAYPITFTIHFIVEILFASKEAPQQLIQSFKGATNGGDSSLLIAIAISAVVVAPICEEIMFRGCFYPVGAKALGRGTSALLMSLIFALIHDTFTAAPSLTALAICFTIAYEATGSLLVPIFCHAAFNAINLLISWWFINLGVPQ
jgi:membrane protease YdiL (CAAX protease family)